MPSTKLTPEQAKASILGASGPEPLPIGHLSYSGMNTMLDCPKKYELSYLMGAPKKGAVWFVGGRAVHRATEEWDVAREERKPFDLPGAWKRIFHEEIELAKAGDPDFLNWRKAGMKKDNPEGESLQFWYARLGPQLVQAYTAWRMRSSWNIWRTPDGLLACELDVGGVLPGMELPFKGFIDRVFQSSQTGQLLLVDLKTGSRKPETPLQLGVYAAAVQYHYNTPVPLGAAFMNRRGDLSEAWDLTRYTPEYVGKMFEQTRRGIEAGFFPAKPGRSCGMCDVSTACYANGGPLAQQFDRDHPANMPGF